MRLGGLFFHDTATLLLKFFHQTRPQFILRHEVVDADQVGTAGDPHLGLPAAGIVATEEFREEVIGAFPEATQRLGINDAIRVGFPNETSEEADVFVIPDEVTIDKSSVNEFIFEKSLDGGRTKRTIESVSFPNDWVLIWHDERRFGREGCRMLFIEIIV